MAVKISYLISHFRGQFSKQSFDRSQSEWYYFLHIPKTAGTTFRHILYENFDQSEIYPNYYELVIKQRSRYFSWKEFRGQTETLFHNGKKLLIGHFGWRVITHNKEHPPRTLTFLRDPLSRVKSAIFYLQKRNRMYSGMSVDEIIDQYILREGSLQARQLGHNPKRDNINQAISNLESIEFIGISERFDQSLQLCNHTFNWELRSIPKRNVGTYSTEAFSAQQIDKIREACEIDYIIYNRGVELFEERLKQMNSS